MALSGSISTSAWSDGIDSCKVVLNWTATQNIANNTSTISWNLTSSPSSGYVIISELRVKLAGEQVSYRHSSNHTQGWSGTVLASGTKTITHNADGTKSFTASVEAGIYQWTINQSGSGTIALNTIPRASSITSAANVTLGNACSVKWTPASSSFKYKLTFSLGNWSATTGFISPGTTSAYTYTGYTIPNNSTLLGQIPNSTTGTMSVKLTTYNSSEAQIGSTSAAKTFTVTVPSDIKPTVGTITLNPADINGQNILVQGKNKITVSVAGCSAGTGSSIKSYTFSGPGISYTGTGTSVTSGGTISNTGTLTYTVTVTDNRGRSTSKSATIACYAYSAPYFTSFNAYRVGSSTSTTANDSGIYARCTYGVAYSSVNGTNDVTVTIYYKKGDGNWASTAAATNSTSTSGSKTLGSIANDSTYTIYAQVTDNYSGTSTSTQITVFSTARTINVKPDGKGVAFGKMAETSGLLDVAWPLKVGGAIDTDKPEQTMKNLSYKGSNVISSTAADTTTNWGNQGNLATVFYSETGKITNQPSQYGFVLNLTNGPNASEVHQLWATQSSGSLLHRGGNASGWNGSWRTLLDSSNYTTYTGSYAAKPVTLYSTTSGNIGTITLSSSAANFAYLEIFYTDNNGRQANSVRVHAPNGKHVTLSCIEPSTSSSEPRLYIRSSGWTISGTSMTVGRSDLSGANRGVYGQLYPNANGTNSDAKVTVNNYIKIFRVVGYN
jgi:hypothetical protein